MLELYELSEAMQALESKIIGLTMETETDGELTQKLSELVGELKENAEERIVELGNVIKNWRGEAEAIKAEVARLNARKKNLERSEAHLKESLKKHMIDMNIPKINAGATRVYIRKSPARCEISDAEEYPATAGVKIVYSMDKGGDMSVEKGEFETTIPLTLNFPTDIDPKLWNIKLTVNPSKTLIKDNWKSTGEEPDGVKIVDNDKTIVIQ